MDVVLFGNGKFASLVWHALTTDSVHNVVGFTVNRDYITDPLLHGLPVVEFEKVEDCFDTRRAGMIVCAGWQQRNNLRRRLSEEARQKGFTPCGYVSSRAVVASNVELGSQCMIFEGAVVQAFARLGEGVILRSGCNLAHHVDVGAWSFVAANAVIGGGTQLGERCFVGLNATILDNLTLGKETLVGAGAIVHSDTRAGQTCLPATRLARPGRDKQGRGNRDA